MFARIRKALTAGIGAAIAAFLPALLDALNVSGFDRVSVERSVLAAVAAGLVVGAATYRVRNAGTVNGSTPGS